MSDSGRFVAAAKSKERAREACGGLAVKACRSNLKTANGFEFRSHPPVT